MRQNVNDYDRRVLDESIPTLGGKSPRAAAKMANGRDKRAASLNTLENHAERHTLIVGHHPLAVVVDHPHGCPLGLRWQQRSALDAVECASRVSIDLGLLRGRRRVVRQMCGPEIRSGLSTGRHGKAPTAHHAK